MRNLRLNPLIVTIIGCVACILAPVLMFFLMIKPTNEQIAVQQGIFDQNKQYLEPNQLPDAKKKLADAQVSLKQTQAQWDYIMAHKNPVIDMSDRWKAWKQYNNEVLVTLGPLLNKFWMQDVFGRKKGASRDVMPLGSLSFTLPTTSDPNSVKPGILTIPISMVQWGSETAGGASNISVIGTFQGDLDHIAVWNKFPRIVQIDGLTLSGYSPFITATYTAKMYEFMTNSDKVGPEVGPPATPNGTSVLPGVGAAPAGGPPGGPPGAPGGPGGPPR
ncbi:MAG TPA: hypothetical protein VGK19_00250 [Capsulimonadaceae bacterium]|jgi:hypothetical protein